MIDLLSEVAGKGTDVVWTNTIWLHHLTAATLRLRLSFAIQLNPISSQATSLTIPSLNLCGKGASNDVSLPLLLAGAHITADFTTHPVFETDIL
jgi:hypothetical protein